MSKLKGLAIAAAVVFFIAYNPDGSASAIATLWSGFLKFVDGAGVVLAHLSGDR